MKGISECISKLLIRKSGKRRLNQPHLVLPCRRFSLAEIKIATNNFDYNLLIERRGTGELYKGFIDDPTNTVSVAIKRVNIARSMERRACHDLRTEVLVLCQLRHPNLIRLIGYCFEDEGEWFLVYEFMVNETLDIHLRPGNPDLIPWNRRLQICVGLVRALHCLHTGLKHTVIHCNVKLSNIRLNEKWEVKLSDFEFSKMGPPSLSKALIRIETDTVNGTLGFMAPKYVRNLELTDKSDVYSFGVILLEVLWGRIASAIWEVDDRLNLASWARKCKREGNINEIVDPYLMGKIAPECFMVYVDIATYCVRNRPERRPAMGEVQVCLEHAMELQESADAAAGDCNYCFDEYTCNDSSGDASPIELSWGDASPIDMGSGDVSPR